MNDETDSKGSRQTGDPVHGQSSRKARLAAALKANMARRKAQARARSDGTGDTNDPDPRGDGQQQDE